MMAESDSTTEIYDLYTAGGEFYRQPSDAFTVADSKSDPARTLNFSPGGKVVFSVKADGRLEPGEGLSHDEATQGLFDCLSTAFPNMIDAWAQQRGWIKPD